MRTYQYFSSQADKKIEFEVIHSPIKKMLRVILKQSDARF